MNITKDERALIDRFKTAFNEIHDFMCDELDLPNEHFATLLGKMLEKQRIKQRDHEFLDNCRELRNHVVHSKKLYMAVPSIYVVERIERLSSRFQNVPTVDSEFATKVETIDSKETMYHVMKLIEDTGFTQFPVYDKGKFINLLTENVLIRWLAKYTISAKNVADLHHIAIDTLELDDDKQHWQFIPRHMTITAATGLFAAKPILEALIITERGITTETPIGIMTRSDALDMLDGKRD